MIKPTIDIITLLMDNYRKLAAVIMVTFFAFPFISIVYLVAEGKGYMRDPTTLAHETIKQLSEVELQHHLQILQILKENATFMKDLITINRGDCLNGAAGRNEMDRCLPPVYKRDGGE